MMRKAEILLTEGGDAKGLIHERSGGVIARRLIKAGTFKERVTGLMGKKDMPQDTAFWIPDCPSIHTFFMKFPLDLIFADKNLRIASVFYDVPAWKIIFGGFRARHVFEMKACGAGSRNSGGPGGGKLGGSGKRPSLQKGDRLIAEPVP